MGWRVRIEGTKGVGEEVRQIAGPGSQEGNRKPSRILEKVNQMAGVEGTASTCRTNSTNRRFPLRALSGMRTHGAERQRGREHTDDEVATHREKAVAKHFECPVHLPENVNEKKKKTVCFHPRGISPNWCQHTGWISHRLGYLIFFFSFFFPSFCGTITSNGTSGKSAYGFSVFWPRRLRSFWDGEVAGMAGGLSRTRTMQEKKVLILADSKAAIVAVKKASKRERRDPDTCRGWLT